MEYCLTKNRPRWPVQKNTKPGGGEVKSSGHASFPVIHKVGNVVNFVLLRSEGKINMIKKSLPPMGIEPATPTP